MREEIEDMIGLVPLNVDLKRLGYLSAMLRAIHGADRRAVKIWLESACETLADQRPSDLIIAPSGLEEVISEVERLLARNVMQNNIAALTALKDR